MPAFFKIDRERRLVMSTFSGVFTHGLSHQEKLLRDPDFASSFSQLLANQCSRKAEVILWSINSPTRVSEGYFERFW